MRVSVFCRNNSEQMLVDKGNMHLIIDRYLVNNKVIIRNILSPSSPSLNKVVVRSNLICFIGVDRHIYFLFAG